MSSIFSDPFFRRGTTLLSDVGTSDLDPGITLATAGGSVVGQVKAFQDVNPSGKGERYSNRIVYCVAARWLGSDIVDASTVAGVAYAFDDATPLTTFTNKATNADVVAGKPIGVLDEYLTGALKQNDIVWLVVKGPVSIDKGSSASVAANAGVELGSGGTAGQVIPVSTGVNIGNSIAGAAVTGSQGTALRVNLKCDWI